ncbi:type I-E CRISPR-associated protein Cse1/CasA [Arthrobacter sp. NPDC090010]|uniref:type I-E CRISPR-associated protein Cse1/CasA n=1 Tax=Arthrobacter sp. NPDC090010 TaxID=3363942 RepID=UPI003814047F
MTAVLPQFNLVRDPWVSCLMTDGVVKELSLTEVFRQSAFIRRLAGELPTQDYAVLRVLLAIVYSSMPRINAGGAVSAWKELWLDHSKLTDSVLGYLDDFESSFELFDPVRPFMQVPELHTQSGKVDGVDRLIADVPSGYQYFTTRAGHGLDALSYAEATRWLIHTHAYDPSGIKSGAVGDPRVKGGKGYPIGTGWAGTTGGVFFEGESLSETLHLNLDLSLVALSEPGSDLPVWERAPLGPAVEERKAGVPKPTGPVDVFTWQSRRIRLFPEAGKVRNVLVCNGDPLPPQNMDADPLTAQRFSKPQTAKFKAGAIYMPREHDPERMIWNGVSALLAQNEQARTNADGIVLLRVPPIVTWVSRLSELDSIDAGRVLNARLVGVVYGTQSSVYTEILDDSLAVHLRLLSESSAAVAQVAKNAASNTEQAVWAFGRFAGELSRAAGGDLDPPQEKARQVAFFALNEPYRRWVSELSGSEDAEAAGEVWNSIARKIIASSATEMLSMAGESALVGRTVDSELVSAATAETWLYRSLRKYLPLQAEIDARAERASRENSGSTTTKGAKR